MTVGAQQRVANHTLRAVRLALHMSQSEFAAAIRHAGDALGEPNTANKRLIQKWESGEHAVCRGNYRRALQSVTRMPFAHLGFPGTPGGVVVAAPVPAPAAAPPAAATQGAAIEREEASAATGQVCDRLRFALERPGQADTEAVDLVEVTTAHLFDLEHHRPARTLLPAVRGHVGDIAALLCGTRREAVRQRLARAGGGAAALAGWLAWERGDVGGAYKAWDTALAAAKRTGDGPLLACVLTYQSYAAAQRGDPATAWQLAHTAIAHAGPDPRARSWMAARAAQEAARFGEKRAALAELDLAMQLGSTLDPAVPQDPSPPWARFFYNAVLGAMAAQVNGRLGRTQQAFDAASWALRSLSQHTVKSRALVLAEVACTNATVGEVQTAVDSAHHAIDLAERLEATLAQRRLRALIPLLAPYTSVVMVRELLARMPTDLP